MAAIAAAAELTSAVIRYVQRDTNPRAYGVFRAEANAA